MTSLYVPPEKWDDSQTAKTIAWQRRLTTPPLHPPAPSPPAPSPSPPPPYTFPHRRVIFQAQRDGNRVRQNGILRDQLGGM